MPHKTFQGDIGDPDAFSDAMDNIIEQALRELESRKLIGVTVTPLSAVGGYPFRFAVTVVTEGGRDNYVEENAEPLDIIIGERSVRVE